MVGDPLNTVEHVRISIGLGESHFREFKSALQGPPSAKSNRSARDIARDVSEALVAFANADGGEIIIGVEDNDEITGIDHLSSDDISQIENAYRSRVFEKTPLSNVRHSKLKIDRKSIIIFSVQKIYEVRSPNIGWKMLKEK